MYPGIFPELAGRERLYMTGYIIVGIIMTVAVFVFVIMAMMKAASISDAVTERYMESVKEKNGGLQKKERELLH